MTGIIPHTKAMKAPVSAASNSFNTETAYTVYNNIESISQMLAEALGLALDQSCTALA